MTHAKATERSKRICGGKSVVEESCVQQTTEDETALHLLVFHVIDGVSP